MPALLGPDVLEWAAVPPPGLAEDLATREGELRALLDASTAVAPPRIAPAPPVAPVVAGFGPPPEPADELVADLPGQLRGSPKRILWQT
ncbi:hypothetical protein [Streptomyces sp. NPDC001714]|uniref:hypothetical protein n=1 Tax=Streptomyces sp. NPDC001714 TaxID=3364603 RepID=UPI0036AFBAE2